MKIIILGAGQVGRTVAQIMAREDNEITVIDLRKQVLSDLQQQLDIRTVVGHASYPEVLVRAGIDDADLIFAVTNNDEVNMVACQVAYSLFQTPTRLARVRSSDYLQHPRLFDSKAVPVTYLINPEQMVTDTIRRLIDHPGAFEIIDLADGKASLVATRVQPDAPMAGQELEALYGLVGDSKAYITTIYRDGVPFTPTASTVAEPGDDIYFFSASRNVHEVIAAFHLNVRENRRVFIAGGGNLGLRLAGRIEHEHQVKIVERDRERCRLLAGSLRRSVVLCGDVTDAELLTAEGIESTDVFCAATHLDRTNIVSAMLAKRLGARKTLAVVNSFGHSLLAEQGSLDIALSPAEVTIGALLTHIRRGDIVTVRSLRKGDAEALEVIARGDRTNSRVVGRSIRDLPMSMGARIGAILRGDRLLFPSVNTVIESDDHVMIMLSDKQCIAEVEMLFQVSITYM